MSKYVIRGSPVLPELPPFEVVRVDSKGFGRDVAWFFSEKDAEEYMKWKACKDAEGKREMTEKEQELHTELRLLAIAPGTCERLIAKARECYVGELAVAVESELKADEMAKLHIARIDGLLEEQRRCLEAMNNLTEKCAKKDAALREALDWIDNECGSSGAAWTADKIREALQ